VLSKISLASLIAAIGQFRSDLNQLEPGSQPLLSRKESRSFDGVPPVKVAIRLPLEFLKMWYNFIISKTAVKITQRLFVVHLLDNCGVLSPRALSYQEGITSRTLSYWNI
jgi:hypothetical protein